MSTITPTNTITIAFSVSNRATTAAWFKEHFGFDEVFSADEAGWTEVATNTPGVTIGFGDMQSVDTGTTVPVFGIDDCDAARSALEAKGVQFEGETMEVPGMVKLATFLDPDGNQLMMAEDLS